MQHFKDTLTPGTVRTYGYAFDALAETVDVERVSDLRRITVEDADRHIAHLQATRQPATAAVYLAAYKVAFKLAARWGYIEQSVWREVKNVKVPVRIPTPLEREALDKFLVALDAENLEYRAVYLFLLFTGCRRLEAVSLRWDDVNLDDRTATLHYGTKGDKQRVVLLPEKLIPVLEAVRAHAPGRVNVFKYGRESLTNHFKDIVRSVGVPDYHLHNLRTTFASVMAETVTPFTLAKLLGHASVRITERYYVRADAEKARTSVEGFTDRLLEGNTDNRTDNLLTGSVVEGSKGLLRVVVQNGKHVKNADLGRKTGS